MAEAVIAGVVSNTFEETRPYTRRHQSHAGVARHVILTVQVTNQPTDRANERPNNQGTE